MNTNSRRVFTALTALLLASACGGTGQVEPTGSGSGAGGASASGAGGSIGLGGAANSTEVCDNGVDDDGDSRIDEDCNCTPGAVKSCFVGPAAKAGVGICKQGSQTCALVDSSEVATIGAWGDCEGSVGPQQEICGDALDSDCDGQKDCEACATEGNCSGGDENTTVSTGSGDDNTTVSTGSGDDNTTVSSGSGDDNTTVSVGSGDTGDCNVSGSFSNPGPDTGVACEPGDVQWNPTAPEGCPENHNVLFCEKGTLHCVYGSCCTPEACKPCLEANCSGITSPNAVCDQAIHDGIDWLAECGPDRSEYYLLLQFECPGGQEMFELNNCKMQNCMPECSPW